MATAPTPPLDSNETTNDAPRSCPNDIRQSALFATRASATNNPNNNDHDVATVGSGTSSAIPQPTEDTIQSKTRTMATAPSPPLDSNETTNDAPKSCPNDIRQSALFATRASATNNPNNNDHDVGTVGSGTSSAVPQPTEGTIQQNIPATIAPVICRREHPRPPTATPSAVSHAPSRAMPIGSITSSTATYRSRLHYSPPNSIPRDPSSHASSSLFSQYGRQPSAEVGSHHRPTVVTGGGSASSLPPPKNNGHRPAQKMNARLIAGKKNKRWTIKLPFIGAILLSLYGVFIYIITNKFTDTTGAASSSNLLRSTGDTIASSQKQQNPTPPGVAVPAGKDPTIKDFCGLCQWRDQGFNCNERVEWSVTQKGVDETEAKLANLRYCVNANGCQDKLNDEGFMDCEEQTEEPTITDFCGRCQFRGQGFNCDERVEWVVQTKGQTEKEAKLSNLRYCVNANKCNDKIDEFGFMQCEEVSALSKKPPPGYKQGTKPHVESEPELEAVLSGSLVMQARDIAISLKDRVGVRKSRENEEGLRDRRSGEDIVASVLTAAQYGDRQYDTEGKFSNAAIDTSKKEGGGGRSLDMPVLTAYCEPVNQTAWETKPLPLRDGATTKESLFSIPYPHVQSCSALPSQWPIDTPPVDLDPFLPWIHDVFPSPDGKNVMFVAQNRRRCYNGQRTLRRGENPPKGVTSHRSSTIHIDYRKNYFMRPQSALFQHVPVKRIPSENPGEDAEPRYRLASHEDADEEGMETRFLCRFKSFDPSATPNLSIVGYSLSKHLLDYDYHTYRKGYKFSATEAGYDNHMIWQSQLLFKCPVPSVFHEKVRNGDTVVEDYANLYVDVIPIRTPPRYTPPREFLQPRYGFNNDGLQNLFIPDIEWGKEHFLPRIDESGRWENIPICMPPLMTSGIVPKGVDVNTRTIPENVADKTYVAYTGELPPKIHKVIACTWASTTFKTRSNRAMVGDGKRRLQEWLEFNLLSGFDHIYVYDNSGAFTNEDSLADIIGLFPPDKVTRVDWPCKICSNRDGNEGERSSQYAAESSCRLRFGTHARWLGSFDTDEYLVPMGEFSSMGEVADELDRKDVKVAVFKSSPAKPRFDLLESPRKTAEAGAFTPTVPADETFLHTYNCNWEQFPRQNDLSYRRKQMYRADYVKLHYVHYSTVTTVSQMSEMETRSSGRERWMHRYVEKHVHEFDEMKESTMLHTKTKVARNMLSWETRCRRSTWSEGGCHVGFPFPKGVKPTTPIKRNDGYAYNCFLNEKIEDYWWPKLVEAVKRRKEGRSNAALQNG